MITAGQLIQVVRASSSANLYLKELEDFCNTFNIKNWPENYELDNATHHALTQLIIKNLKLIGKASVGDKNFSAYLAYKKLIKGCYPLELDSLTDKAFDYLLETQAIEILLQIHEFLRGKGIAFINFYYEMNRGTIIEKQTLERILNVLKLMEKNESNIHTDLFNFILKASYHFPKIENDDDFVEITPGNVTELELLEKTLLLLEKNVDEKLKEEIKKEEVKVEEDASEQKSEEIEIKIEAEEKEIKQEEEIKIEENIFEKKLEEKIELKAKEKIEESHQKEEIKVEEDVSKEKPEEIEIKIEAKKEEIKKEESSQAIPSQETQPSEAVNDQFDLDPDVKKYELLKKDELFVEDLIAKAIAGISNYQKSKKRSSNGFLYRLFDFSNGENISQFYYDHLKDEYALTFNKLIFLYSLLTAKYGKELQSFVIKELGEESRAAASKAIREEIIKYPQVSQLNENEKNIYIRQINDMVARTVKNAYDYQERNHHKFT